MLRKNASRKTPRPSGPVWPAYMTGSFLILCLVLAGCPEPKPPDPPIPPPVEATHLYLVHETADSTPETAAVRADKTWKDAAEQKGINWLIVDDDVGEEFLPAIVEAARQCGLPAVVLRDADKVIVETVPMPDRAGMLSLVEKHGGKKP